MAYKPRVKFQATTTVPNILREVVVRKRVDKHTYVNFTNKADLTDYVDSLYEPPTSDTYLQAVCDCGRDYSYTTKTDVPNIDVTCVCGREVIKYS